MARSIHSSRRGLWLIIYAAMLWGTTGVVAQTLYGLSATNPLSVTFFRMAIGALVLSLFCWRSLGQRLWQVKRRDALLMLCMGVMMAISQYCYYAAIPESGVTIATLLTICLTPVFVVLLATLFLRECITRKILLALFCAMLGTALLTGAPSGKEASGSLLMGVLLSVLSAMTYAVVILIGRSLSNRYHPLQINAASFSSGSLLLLAGSLVTPLVLSYPLGSWLLLLYLGCIPTALAYVLFQVGMRSTSAMLTSILTFCEPLTAAILAWLFLGERLSLLGILGALLLLGTIALLTLVGPTPEGKLASDGATILSSTSATQRDISRS